MNFARKAPKAPPKQASRTEEKLRQFHEESSFGKAYDARLIRRLWPFVRPYRAVVAASLVTLLIISALNLARPLVLGSLIRAADAKDGAALFRGGMLLAGLMVSSQVLTFVQSYTMQLGGARAMADLREHIFLFLQRLSLRYFDRTPVGRLVTRATNDVDALSELFASGVLNAMGDLLSLIGIVSLMLYLDWQLSLMAFAALPFVALLVNFVRKRSREAYRDIRTKTARLNAYLNEQVNGIAVVQAFSRENSAALEFDDINYAFLDANKRSIYYEATLDAAIEMVSVICIASILWYAGLRHAEHGALAFATVVTFTQYIRQFFEPVSQLSARYTVLQSAMSAAERIFQLLDETSVDSEISDEKSWITDGAGEEALALDHVDFEYKAGVPVLKDITFTATKGQRIALVGATGAGKTTVASVLLRLYDVAAGGARVLGKDVRSYSRAELRRLFSVVPQDVFLFSGTVLSNIAMSDQHPSHEKAEQALKRIGAHERFMRREGGLMAPVDERGTNFSAGERQLLAFARAVYRDAPILILDEATASVDSDTEADLQRALEAVLAQRTALIIAHRLSTIRSVDYILVFHKGRIVERGNHESLLAQNGVYARLYRLQFSKDEAKSPDANSLEAKGSAA